MTEIKSNKYKYKNKLGTFDAYFSGEGQSNPAIQVVKDKIAVEIRPQNTASKGIAAEDNQILYPSKQNGVSYLYTVHNSGVKEDIILNHYIDNPVFTYEMNIQGPAEAVKQEGIIDIVNKSTKETVFTFAAPYMEDKEGNQSFDLSLSVDKKSSKHIITLKAEDSWLKDPRRVYPVRIDPSITVSGSSISDNFVQQINPKYAHSNEFMIYTGYDDGVASQNKKLYGNYKGITRGYLKFNLPNSLKSTASTKVTIESASLNLYKYTHWSDADRQIQLHKITSNVSINNIVWGSQPAVSGPLASVTIGGEREWKAWDVKSLVESWLKDNNNYGVCLKMSNEQAQADCFYSTNHADKKPYVTINYKSEPASPSEPQKPPVAGDLELVLERNNMMENGTAYAKSTLEAGTPPTSDTEIIDGNKATITYKLMPEGIEKEIVKENITTFNWETEKFDLKTDKPYWIEAHAKLEDHVVPLPPPTAPGAPPQPAPTPFYRVRLEQDFKSTPFLVSESQPGDTLRRMAKHYLYDGEKHGEIKELNKLEKDALTVGQTLFIYTDNEKPQNYKQPKQVSPEIQVSKDQNGFEYTTYFDAMGRAIATQDPKQNMTRMSYDKSGNIIEIQYPGTEAVQRITSYTYDEDGNLSAVIDGKNNRTDIQYDAQNRAYKMNIPDPEAPKSNKTQYSYDELGRVNTMTDVLNQTTDYIYDELNRFSEIQYPGGDKGKWIRRSGLGYMSCLSVMPWIRFW